MRNTRFHSQPEKPPKYWLEIFSCPLFCPPYIPMCCPDSVLFCMYLGITGRRLESPHVSSRTRGRTRCQTNIQITGLQQRSRCSTEYYSHIYSEIVRNLDGVTPLITELCRCNFTNTQKSPIHQNGRNF